MLTDIILAVFCFYFYIQIKKRPSTEQGKTYFAQFFLWMAFCTFLGGVLGHGFLPYIGPIGKWPARILTVVTMMFLQFASIDLIRKRIPSKLYLVLMVVTTFLAPLFIYLAFSRNHFSYAIFHNIAAALMIIPIFIFCLIKYKTEGTKWVLGALLLSSVIPYFQINRIGINQWFTYHDVCHTMMLISFYLLYIGAYKLYKDIEY